MSIVFYPFFIYAGAVCNDAAITAEAECVFCQGSEMRIKERFAACEIERRNHAGVNCIENDRLPLFLAENVVFVEMCETMAASVIAGFDDMKVYLEIFHNDYLLRSG